MVTSVIPLRSNAIATQIPDMPAPMTATAGSRLVIELSGFRTLLETLQGEADVLGVGGHPIGDAGGPAGKLGKPARAPVPGALGDAAAAIGGEDVVLPARYGKHGVPHVECEDTTGFGIGHRALRGPAPATVLVATDEDRPPGRRNYPCATPSPRSPRRVTSASAGR